MARYTDLKCVQDDEGIFDLVLDADSKDVATVDGFEGAVVVSMFSDRRAAADEVADPMKRRGWIGNLVAETPDDNHGSGLWLYEQHRLTAETASGVRLESEAALEWLVAESLCQAVTVTVVRDPESRRVFLAADVSSPDGGVTQYAYRLIDATQRGIIAKLGAI